MFRYFLLSFFIGSFFILGSCSDLKESLEEVEDFFFDENFEEAPGEPIKGFLAAPASVKSTNIDAVLEAMKIGEEESAIEDRLYRGETKEEENPAFDVSNNAIKILRSSSKSKREIEPENFETPLFSQGSNEVLSPFFSKTDFSNDKISNFGTKDSYVVSMVDKIPVKNQGQRGTCAAFAGIGHLEAVILKQYGNKVDYIDLSEQRFYYMSKEDFWKTGGKTNKDGGSDAGSGFNRSYGLDDIYAESDNNPNFNIPLESDCKYNEKPGKNELQVPQASGCRKGILKVNDYASFSHQSSKRPKTAQEILDLIKNEDLPVVAYTKLSKNWYRNDGMVTLAGAKEQDTSSHGGGHAYLIVGAKKIDEKKFPGEGGMCFIIKNSWGKGWGVNGYSCMTLAWFNKWRFPFAVPVVFKVDLDSKLLKDGSNKDEEENLPVPAEYKKGFLVLDDMSKRKVLYKIEGDAFFIKALLQGRDQYTNDLKLLKRDDELIFDDSKYGKRTVGKISSDEITLCSNQFADVCVLNFISADKSLVLGITKEESERYTPEGPFDWTTILKLIGYAISISLPSDASQPYADFKFTYNGKDMKPFRLKIKPVSGDILYQGTEVGNYQEGEFCSGEFKDLCRFVINKDEFNIFFKSKRNTKSK